MKKKKSEQKLNEQKSIQTETHHGNSEVRRQNQKQGSHTSTDQELSERKEET